MVCRKDVKAGGNCKKYEHCDKPCRAQCPLRVVSMDAFCSEWNYFPDNDEKAVANVPSTVVALTMSSASVVSSTIDSIFSFKGEISKDKATLDVKVSNTVLGNPDFGTQLGHWIVVFLAVIFAVMLALLFCSTCSTCAKLYGNFNEWVERRTVRKNRDVETQQVQQGVPTAFNAQQELTAQLWRQQSDDNMRLMEAEKRKRRLEEMEKEIEKDNENYRRMFAENFGMQDRPAPAMMVSPPRTQPQV
jgi:hypothetical protein